MHNADIFGPTPPGSNRRNADAGVARSLLFELLGDLPVRTARIGSRKTGEEKRETYVLERLELELNGFETVPAYFARPRDARGPLPTILFNHSHGGRHDVGKQELVDGRDYLHSPPYAEALTREGWAVLAIDHWIFGERAHSSESDLFKAMLWQGRVLWGMMVFDSLRALDYLQTRDDVDPERIGTLGMSMGSTMSWWLAALDERVKVTIDICCLTDFHTLLEKRDLERHGIYYYVPGLLKHFTTADINALIAPRAHLSIAGLRDRLTPVTGLDIIDRELKKIYAEKGAPDNWRLLRYDVAHQETAEARQEILEFLRKHL